MSFYKELQTKERDIRPVPWFVDELLGKLWKLVVGGTWANSLESKEVCHRALE
jgi:hypothetical protein